MSFCQGESIIGIDGECSRELREKADIREEDKFPVARLEKGRPIEEMAD